MFRSKRVQSTGRVDKNSVYAMSRYVSNLKGVVEQLSNEKVRRVSEGGERSTRLRIDGVRGDISNIANAPPAPSAS